MIVEHRDRDVVQFSEATCGSIFELNVVKVLLSKTFQLLSPFQSFRQSMNFPACTVALPGIWFLLFFWSKSWRGLIGHLSSSINGAALIFDMATKRTFLNQNLKDNGWFDHPHQIDGNHNQDDVDNAQERVPDAWEPHLRLQQTLCA